MSSSKNLILKIKDFFKEVKPPVVKLHKETYYKDSINIGVLLYNKNDIKNLLDYSEIINNKLVINKSLHFSTLGQELVSGDTLTLDSNKYRTDGLSELGMSGLLGSNIEYKDNSEYKTLQSIESSKYSLVINSTKKNKLKNNFNDQSLKNISIIESKVSDVKQNVKRNEVKEIGSILSEDNSVMIKEVKKINKSLQNESDLITVEKNSLPRNLEHPLFVKSITEPRSVKDGVNNYMELLKESEVNEEKFIIPEMLNISTPEELKLVLEKIIENDTKERLNQRESNILVENNETILSSVDIDNKVKDSIVRDNEYLKNEYILQIDSNGRLKKPLLLNFNNVIKTQQHIPWWEVEYINYGSQNYFIVAISGLIFFIIIPGFWLREWW